MLTRAKKVHSSGNAWQLIRLNPSHEEMLQELGLTSRPEEPPKKKPGRPKKSESNPASKESDDDLVKGKRRRGRPKGSKNKPRTITNAIGNA